MCRPVGMDLVYRLNIFRRNRRRNQQSRSNHRSHSPFSPGEETPRLASQPLNPKIRKEVNHKDYGISNEKFNDIKEMFKMYDKNGDGRISKGELMLTMQLIGANPTKDEVENMIREVDTDGNGYIEFKEFVQFAKVYLLNRDPEKELRDAFKVFDRNGDGVLDASEISKIMRSMGERLSEREIQAMINEADRNGDGKIDIDEFVKMLLSNN
ncbi:neo-calmodulin-like [Convolutriloba macropyga]|uniref:neo-calmodulin-like n=1 Tax=Convolutriloba macropyga TaxID=536237 RepID=UPI003F5248F3